MNPVSGSVVRINSRLGGLMPFRKAGIEVLREGYMLASQERKRHHPPTKANWMMVRVTGLGKVFRIWPAEVFARVETPYQTPQRICAFPLDQCPLPVRATQRKFKEYVQQVAD
jgi:hypothetical protein